MRTLPGLAVLALILAPGAAAAAVQAPRSSCIACHGDPDAVDAESAALAKEAIKTGLTVKALVEQKKILPPDQLDEVLDLRAMTELGVPGGKRRGRPPGSKNKRRRGRPPGSKNKRRGRKPARKGSKRSQNKFNLGDSLAAAIRAGTTVSPAEAIKKVKAAGYKTISKAFNVSVSQNLAKDKRFKRTGRGQYLRVAG